MFNDFIRQEEDKIRNSKLFVAAAQKNKNLTLLKKLIEDGADVNYVGSGGNTPLHCAVKNGSFGTVCFLLEKGADVCFENDDEKSPYDFVICARTKKDKRIKTELQKTLVKNASAVLDNYFNDTKETNKLDIGVGPEVNSPMFCDKNFEFKFDSNKKDFFREINKKGEKLKTCLRYLKKLNHTKFSHSSTKFKYEEVYIFIFFLETVAFQDVELTGQAKRQIRKEIESKVTEINRESEKEIEEKIKKEKENIVKDVKKFFTTKFYPPNFQNDLELVNTLRKRLCHSGNNKFTLGDVGKFVCTGTTTSDLFSKLEEYVTFINDKIDATNRLDMPKLVTTNLTSVLKNPKETIGKLIDDKYEELAELIRATYDQDKWTSDRAQEIMFSFLVNIYPAFENEKDFGIKKLRNKIIHEFYRHDDIDSIIEMEFKKTLYDIRSKLFKHYYSKTVHEILRKVKPLEDLEVIDNNLRTALKKFEEKFGKDFKIASQEDADNRLEYQSTLTSAKMTEPSSYEYVIQYLKFMTIVEDDEIKHGKKNSQHFQDTNQYNENHQSSDEEEDETEIIEDLIEKNYSKTSNFSELNIYNRRDIFDDFIKLKQLKLYNLSPSTYLQEKNALKKHLSESFGVDNHYFDAVCENYVEKDNQLPQENQSPVDNIIKTINDIRKFQSEHCLSMRDIILLYTEVVKRKDIYYLQGLDFLKNKNLSMRKVEKFQRDISALHKDDIIYVKIFGEVKVKLNIVKIVSNILMMFCNTYNSYQMKFNNIEEAFKDKEFLDNMIEQEKIYQKTYTDKNANFDFCNYKFMIFKTLLKIKYTAPYIVRSIAEEGNENVMEKNDMIELMQSLLENNDYMDHASELLKVYREGDDLYQSVLEKLLKSDVAEMRQIFEEPIHVKKILEILKEFNSKVETKVNFEVEITKLLNDIVYNLYSEGSYEKALELFEIHLAEQDDEDLSLELLQARRLEAIVRNRKGQYLKRESRLRDNCEHTKALDILINIKKVIEKRDMQFYDINYALLYLLTLSHIANTYHLLRENEKSLKELNNLFSKIISFTLNRSTKSLKTSGHMKDHEKLARFTQEKTYTDLLAFSDEAKESLDVLIILKYISNQKYYQSRTTTSVDEALKIRKSSLLIFRKVYRVQKTSPQDLNQLSHTSWRIGTICNNLAKLSSKKHPKNKFIEVIKSYYVEALKHYTLMFQMETKQRKQMDHSKVTISMNCIRFTLSKLLETKKFDAVQVEKLTNIHGHGFPRNGIPPKRLRDKIYPRKSRETVLNREK